MNCNGECGGCNVEGCGVRKEEDLISKLDKGNIKKIIGIVSSKGGVGKSFVSSVLASQKNKEGYKVGILDADITGPSIPMNFGLREKAIADSSGIIPEESKNGVKVMSINLLVDDPTEPVVWRGPIIAGAIKQFFEDVNWGELDYLFIDLPPGTGDAHLTVYQTIHLDGIIIVTTPQDLVGMIVEKSIKMAKKMNIEILGIIENMSYFKCDECGKKMKVFGEGNISYLSDKFGIKKFAKLPLDPEFSKLCDKGMVENINIEEIVDFSKKIK